MQRGAASEMGSARSSAEDGVQGGREVRRRGYIGSAVSQHCAGWAGRRAASLLRAPRELEHHSGQAVGGDQRPVQLLLQRQLALRPGQVDVLLPGVVGCLCLCVWVWVGGWVGGGQSQDSTNAVQAPSLSSARGQGQRQRAGLIPSPTWQSATRRRVEGRFSKGMRVRMLVKDRRRKLEKGRGGAAGLGQRGARSAAPGSDEAAPPPPCFALAVASPPHRPIE